MNDCYLNFLVSFRALFSLDVGANLVNSKQTIGIILPDLSLLGYAVPVESFGIGLFVILFTYLIIVGTIDNLRSYLFISLKNKLCDELRRRMYMSDTAVEEVSISTPTDVEDDYMEEEQRKNEFSLVRRLLDQLSPRQREALTLYYIEEKKYEDICEIMNMNYQSVRNLMHRGLTKLRSLAS